MARIYISSTYTDLAEHREAVYRVLRRMGHDVIAIEDYAATDTRLLDKSLADVASSDLYIGILAWRYGYILPGENQSTVELEFREAVRQEIPRLLFLLDEDAPWPRTLFDEDLSRVEAFRKELKRDYIVGFFSNPGNLATQVSIAVANMEIGRTVADSIIVAGDQNIAVGKSGAVVGRDVTLSAETQTRVLSESEASERIGQAARLNLDQLQKNMTQARKESSQFFRLTLVFSSLGFVVVILGVVLLLLGQVTAGVVSSIVGIVPEVVAALFFRKDRELRATIEGYHQHIINSQQILTMIDVSETVEDSSERDKIKMQIIYKTLNISTKQPNASP